MKHSRHFSLEELKVILSYLDYLHIIESQQKVKNISYLTEFINLSLDYGPGFHCYVNRDIFFYVMDYIFQNELNNDEREKIWKKLEINEFS